MTTTVFAFYLRGWGTSEVVSVLDLGTCMTSVCRGKLIVIFGTMIECLLYTKHCIGFYWPQCHLISCLPKR